MSFRQRFMEELQKLYEELLRTPPLVILLLTCLAVVLVGVIMIGASR
jgi:hypothetical protein